MATLPVIITTGTTKSGKPKGEYFKVEFDAKDFDKVVEEIGKATIDTIHTNPLWKVI